MNKNLTIKLGAIALLILLLLIPLLMIDGIIDDRQQRRDGVLEDIARSSSYSQQISGPVMVVPYRKVIRTWKTREKTASNIWSSAKSVVACTSCRSASNSTITDCP